jgi:uncharacterized protein
MQSNGTRFSEERLQFYKDNNVGIGISFDGCEKAQNLGRPLVGYGPSYPKVIEGLQLTKRVFGGLGVCVVLTKNNINDAAEIFCELNNLGVSSVNLIPYMNYPYNRSYVVTSEELFAFWAEFMELYFGTTHSFDRVSPFFQYMSGILGKATGYCLCDEDCLGNALCFDANGDIYFCDLVSPENVLGNILYQPDIDKILNEDKARNVRLSSLQYLEKHCGSCEVRPACGGGCRAAAYAMHGAYDAPDPYCEARKAIIDWLYTKLAGYCRQSDKLDRSA